MPVETARRLLEALDSFLARYELVPDADDAYDRLPVAKQEQAPRIGPQGDVYGAFVTSPIPRPGGFGTEIVPKYRPPGIPPWLKPINVNTRNVEAVLRRYTDRRHPIIARWLYSTWNANAEELTFQEIRNAIRDGEFGPEVIERWQQRYSALIAEHLEGEWRRTIGDGMTYAARGLARTGRKVMLHQTAERIARWIEARGTELAVALTETQHEALRAVIRHHLLLEPVGPEEMARRLRAIIGLTPKEAQAVQAYRLQLLAQGFDARKVEHQVQNYAAWLNRRRALRIARTESSFAFNYGQLEIMRQAVEQGLARRVVKTWLTARDERVCGFCGPLDGQEIMLEETFPGATRRLPNVYVPPAHPSCRCTVLYQVVP